MGKCVGVWGDEGRGMWSVGEGNGTQGCKEVCGRVYGGECGKVHWGVGIGEGYGGSGKGRWGCEEVWGRYGGVYRVSVEKCVG